MGDASPPSSPSSWPSLGPMISRRWTSLRTASWSNGDKTGARWSTSAAGWRWERSIASPGRHRRDPSPSRLPARDPERRASGGDRRRHLRPGVSTSGDHSPPPSLMTPTDLSRSGWPNCSTDTRCTAPRRCGEPGSSTRARARRSGTDGPVDLATLRRRSGLTPQEITVQGWCPSPQNMRAVVIGGLAS